MSADPCLDAAMAYVARKNVRRSMWKRLWSWYLRVVGYAPRRELSSPRYQSTVTPGGDRCPCLLCNPGRLP